MSDMQDFSAYRSEESHSQENRFDPMAVLPEHVEKSSAFATHALSEVVESLDGHSYPKGEVPQAYLVDPKAFLPLNSERLVASSNVIEQLLGDVNILIQDEVHKIQVLQKKITFWEERIEKNKAMISANMNKIKENVGAILLDKKNRDYWWVRSEAVLVDYSNAESANREEDWEWLVKKYGLKNADGNQVDPRGLAVEELCNGGTSNLAGEYRNSGNKYEQARKDKEAENNQLIRENSRLKASNETLQGYISQTYKNEIEPLQDGVLMFKELGVKLKSLAQDSTQVSYGDLRAWAEPFLNDFIKSNPRVPQSVVTDFRKLASIPLPAEHC